MSIKVELHEAGHSERERVIKFGDDVILPSTERGGRDENEGENVTESRSSHNSDSSPFLPSLPINGQKAHPRSGT